MRPIGVVLGVALAIPLYPCSLCHPQIAQTYGRTGMARSFYAVAPENTPDEISYYHAASDRHFRISRKGGRYAMRRWQLDENNRETNVVEKTIDYVLGSGNHARSYVSRAPDGRLIALPLAWYAENGGHWAMAPGYDRLDHADLRREIGFDCIFCHNGYPKLPAGLEKKSIDIPILRGPIPQGIDCERCHGPGDAHAAAAREGAAQERLRSTIVNPRRLSHDRQLEVCLQCHLQSTSRRLPYAIRRFDREVFSYGPGEPLKDYMLHFDLAPGAARSTTFEVVSAGSRFLQSRCYQASAGKLTCTTCHNPHDVPRDAAAGSHYTAVCQQCHPAPHHKQRVSSDCTGCHMPKRRTDDAVHVVMTDHLIQRHPTTVGMLAAKHEIHEPAENSYLGAVVPLYPKNLQKTDELYLAVAQVREGANLVEGIVQLQNALAKFKPKEPEFYYEAAEALRKAGKAPQSVVYYEQAIERAPHFVPAVRALGAAYQSIGDTARAITLLDRANSLEPYNIETLNALGSAYYQRGRLAESMAILRQAIAVNAEVPETHLNLGASLAAAGELDGSLAALREAIRLRPDFAEAHNNLAVVLDRQGQTSAARRHFERAIQLRPAYMDARHNFGLHLARRAEWRQAREHLLEAVRLAPSFEPARLNLARTLIAAGNNDEAVPYVRTLIESKSAQVREDARELMKIVEAR